MSRVWGGWFALVFALLGAQSSAKDATPLALARGARIGVISLLDPEVTHFHAAKSIKDTALHTEPVNWSVAGTLVDALKDRAA